MRPNKLRELLKSDKPTVSTHIHSTWPSVVEAIGHTGIYDYVEYVAEYAPYDLHDLDNMCRAAELFDMGMMIKVDWETNAFVAQRAVGSGFGSVLFADIRSVEDARHCIASVRPDAPGDLRGTYGVATRRATYMGYGGTPEYVEAIREVVVMLMIEKQGAIDHLEEIVELPGLDMVQWGGSDYSMNIGKAGQRRDPAIKAVEKHVIETSLKAGVHPRAEIGSPDEAKYYLDLGVRHFSIGTDLFVLYQWLKEKGGELRKAIEG